MLNLLTLAMSDHPMPRHGGGGFATVIILGLIALSLMAMVVISLAKRND